MPRATLIAPLALMLMFTPAAHGAPRPNTHAGPARARNTAAQRHLDINALNLYVSNFGNVGFDALGFSNGMFFPRGTNNSPLFAGGLWVGGLVSIVAGLGAAVVAARSGGTSAGGILVGALTAEGVKLALIAILLWLVLATYDAIVPLAFFGSFVATMLVFSMAFFVRDN